MHWGDELTLRLRRLGHPLCLGLDPHLALLPQPFRTGSMDPTEPATSEAIERFLTTVIDLAADRVAVVKPQIAFFEQLGWRGLRALENVIAHARSAGLLVLLDAKRGDIGSTAEAYAEAWLGAASPAHADAITVNPYLGRDSLAPFLAKVGAEGRGVFVLVRTSNPGAADLQQLETAGAKLYEKVAEMLAPEVEAHRGPETGWSSVGVVVGATWPGEAERVRELLPGAIFLVPGYGAQGGSASDAMRGFVKGPDGRLEGGIVNSSRGVLFPKGAESAAAWERGFDEALGRAEEELGAALYFSRGNTS
ncbi:MAG: orotidine-5'-phosphate decarboxylase [Thermoanaerobaculia bacterium]|nr:orotidine-5'-phosphate decarboxylase [Thermoanaerobaculia bacterium]